MRVPVRLLAAALGGALAWAPGSAVAAGKPSAPAAVGPESGPVGEPPEERPVSVPEVFEERGVLTPRGAITLQPSVEHDHSSVNRVAIEGFALLPAIVIGEIDVRKVRRNTEIMAVTVRYGLTSRLEAELHFPFVLRQDSTTSRILGELTEGPEETTEVSGSGVGDVEMTARYQLTRGRERLPYLIGNLRVKTSSGTGPFEVELDPETGLQEELPTGSGFWSVQPSLTAVLPTDPAVLFANLSYLWQVERSVEGAGEIDPGDAVGVNFGMGLALNEELSFSVGYEHTAVFQTRQEGRRIPGSDLHVGSLLLGYSYRVGEGASVNLSLGVGVTDDSPDVRVALRVPLTTRGLTTR